jgi:tripartite-type tricarboxylate transporter receptor subunit TctC
MQGILAPAGTPRPVIDLLRREIVAVMEMPDVRAKMVALGFETVASTPEEFSDRIRAEIPKWGKVIRDAKIKIQ